MSNDFRQQQRKRECAAMGHVWQRTPFRVCIDAESWIRRAGTDTCERCGKAAHWSVESYWLPYSGYVESVSPGGGLVRVVISHASPYSPVFMRAAGRVSK